MYGQLDITVVKANNLPNGDGGLAGDLSDPKVMIRAYMTNGGYFTKWTNVYEYTLNPIINEKFVLGRNHWDYFTIEAWDDDDFWRGSDDRLTETYVVPISAPCNENIVVGNRKGTNIVCSYFIDYS